jgi:DNA-binding NtrC family response regulator
MSKIRTKVLIVDDKIANLQLLRQALQPEGYEILGTAKGQEALRIAADARPDIILLDIVMPGMDGYEVCRRLKQQESTSQIPVIFVTVKADNVSLVEGFGVGGVDYINKPVEKEELLVRVETHLKINRLTKELLQKNLELSQKNLELQQEITKRKQAEDAQRQAEDERQRADDQLSIISQQEAKRWGIDAFVGKSNTISTILTDIRQLQSVRSTSVLIVGESGTGKELIARAIHFGGQRKGPFIPLNCSAIPGELAESTLFGHLKGAFTGAKEARRGYFEIASGGTLFLDEIGDMPLELQPKLLRVIEDGLIMPVGGVKEKQVDVRIIAATNQNLLNQIAQGDFREDLYFRLERFTVTVPPLRERQGDIPLLVEHFLSLFATEMGIPLPALSPAALRMLEDYHFPGNVRELKNIIERAMLKSSGEATITPQHLQFIDSSDFPVAHTATSPQKVEFSQELQQIEELVIQRSQKQSQTDQMTDEERILAYFRERGSISNPECRKLLTVDKRRASYLLQKMERYGLLERKGEHRWSRYYLT